jgi:Family of unknown function (DUF6186)
MTLSRVLIISAFLLAFFAFAVVEWLSRREDSKIPSMGDVTAFVMQYEVGRLPVGRVAVYGFWWWVGWHFFAR